MRDLEDDLRERPTDPEQALRVNRMASLEGQPSPTYPGSGQSVYIITFSVKEPDLMGGSDLMSGPHTVEVRSDTPPSKNRAARMVTETQKYRDLHPREVEVERVRSR